MRIGKRYDENSGTLAPGSILDPTGLSGTPEVLRYHSYSSDNCAGGSNFSPERILHTTAVGSIDLIF